MLWKRILGTDTVYAPGGALSSRLFAGSRVCAPTIDEALHAPDNGLVAVGITSMTGAQIGNGLAFARRVRERTNAPIVWRASTPPFSNAHRSNSPGRGSRANCQRISPAPPVPRADPPPPEGPFFQHFEITRPFSKAISALYPPGFCHEYPSDIVCPGACPLRIAFRIPV